MQHKTRFDDLIIYIYWIKCIFSLLVPVSWRLHGLSGYVLVPTQDFMLSQIQSAPSPSLSAATYTAHVKQTSHTFCRSTEMMFERFLQVFRHTFTIGITVRQRQFSRRVTWRSNQEELLAMASMAWIACLFVRDRSILSFIVNIK